GIAASGLAGPLAHFRETHRRRPKARSALAAHGGSPSRVALFGWAVASAHERDAAKPRVRPVRTRRGDLAPRGRAGSQALPARAGPFESDGGVRACDDVDKSRSTPSPAPHGR